MIARIGPTLDAALREFFALGYTPKVRAYTRAIALDADAALAFADALGKMAQDVGGLPALGTERKNLVASVCCELMLLDAELATVPRPPEMVMRIVSYGSGAGLVGGFLNDEGFLAPRFVRDALTDDPVVDLAALTGACPSVSYTVHSQPEAMDLLRVATLGLPPR